MGLPEAATLKLKLGAQVGAQPDGKGWKGHSLQAVGKACAKARGSGSEPGESRAVGGTGGCRRSRDQVSRSSCQLTPLLFPGPPPAPCRSSRPQRPLSLLSQSRGLSSTLCPAQAIGSVSPAWTLTRCLQLPRSSWTSCSTPMGTSPLNMRGRREPQSEWGDRSAICPGSWSEGGGGS